MTRVSVIGQSVPRLDGREKATGATRYAGDLRLPGMLHARLVLSPHAHARIVAIDSGAAAAQPGVVGVFTGHDLPLVKADPTDRGRCPLAIGRVAVHDDIGRGEVRDALKVMTSREARIS